MNSRAVEPVPMPITPSGGSSASAATAAWRLKSSVMGTARSAEDGSVGEVVDREHDGAQQVLLGDAGLDPDLVVVGRDGDRLDHRGDLQRDLAGRLEQAELLVDRHRRRSG